MRLPVRLRIPALGDLEIIGELELPADLIGTQQPAHLTDSELCDRWQCSSRSLKRLRDQRKLPYLQPTARRVLYSIADVERFEQAHRVEAGGLRPLRRRANGHRGNE